MLIFAKNNSYGEYFPSTPAAFPHNLDIYPPKQTEKTEEENYLRTVKKNVLHSLKNFSTSIIFTFKIVLFTQIKKDAF